MMMEQLLLGWCLSLGACLVTASLVTASLVTESTGRRGVLQIVLDSLSAAVAMLRSEDEPQDSANLTVLCQVNTASQKAIQKMERKANKRKNGRQGNKATKHVDFDYIRTVGWAALQACSTPASLAQPACQGIDRITVTTSSTTPSPSCTTRRCGTGVHCFSPCRACACLHTRLPRSPFRGRWHTCMTRMHARRTRRSTTPTC